MLKLIGFKKFLLLSFVLSFTNITVGAAKGSELVAKKEWTCESVAEFAGQTFLRNHLLAASTEEKFQKILNTTERKEKLLKLFLSELDPYRVLLTEKEYTAIKSDFVAVDMSDSKEICVPLEKLTNQIKNNQKKFVAEVNEVLNSDSDTLYSQIKDLDKSLEDKKIDIKVTSEKYDKTYPADKKARQERIKFYLFNSFRSFVDSKESKDDSFVAALRVMKHNIDNMNILSHPDDVGLSFMNSYVSSVDVHNQIFSPEGYKDYLAQVRGEFSGIGAEVGVTAKGIRIKRMLPGSAVSQTGLFDDGDIITAIDDKKEYAMLPLRKAIKKLKGPRGEVVKLDVLKKDGSKFQANIRRGSAVGSDGVVKEVREINNKKWGYISFKSFFGNRFNPKDGVAYNVEQKIVELNKEKVRGLILDLRGNGGGYINEAVALLKLFLGPRQVVIQTLAASSQGLNYITPYYYKDWVAFEYPMIVLIDENSASASEIVAGSLKEFNRAIVMGSEQSFGKGLVQNLETIDKYFLVGAKGRYKDYGMKVTDSAYYLASGESPQYQGVKSDVVISPKKKDAVVYSERAMNPIMKAKDLPVMPNLFKSKRSHKLAKDKDKAEMIKVIKSMDFPSIEEVEGKDIVKEMAFSALEVLFDTTVLINQTRHMLEEKERKAQEQEKLKEAS